ncbi:MAG: fibrobacter succinogenes major paralogous domain-containing protein, partial [Bacteroidetes bacterium]|nr:fibrobacter succinogenes major paralogous domain-containing protein [Bacteroidota bacterium]
WSPPNTGANNQTGFTALPGGVRSSFDGSFNSQTQIGGYWTATESDAANANYLMLYYNRSDHDALITSKYTGLSVRCIMTE